MSPQNRPQHYRIRRMVQMVRESAETGYLANSGNIQITKDISVDLKETTVLLVDDILDSGRTLDFAKRHVENKGAAQIRTCCLLDKPARRALDVHADFIGFEVPDTFVVGYGLDFDSHYRELPFLGEVVFEPTKS
jgi:hypoxanthine phosphoribosyltransferase